MAWFENYYECGDCEISWTDEWSCGCDDECPTCGSSSYSPIYSKDLTSIVIEEDGTYSVYVSPNSAGHYADYRFFASTENLHLSRVLAKIGREVPDAFLGTRHHFR